MDTTQVITSIISIAYLLLIVSTVFDNTYRKFQFGKDRSMVINTDDYARNRFDYILYFWI
jgi:hypothetical protein